jgi:hypothetical protein
VILQAIVSEMLFLVSFRANRVQRLGHHEPWQDEQTISVQCLTAGCAKLIVIEGILPETHDLAKFFDHSGNPL